MDRNVSNSQPKCPSSHHCHRPFCDVASFSGSFPGTSSTSRTIDKSRERINDDVRMQANSKAHPSYAMSNHTISKTKLPCIGNMSDIPTKFIALCSASKGRITWHKFWITTLSFANVSLLFAGRLTTLCQWVTKGSWSINNRYRHPKIGKWC